MTASEVTPDRPHKLAALHSSASVEHTTPPEIIDRVVRVLGAIDLDPCAEPEQSVPAARHITARDDGLDYRKRWDGRVYVNPPYGRGVGAWVTRFSNAYSSGEMEAGLLLVAARTDTRWFRLLWRFPVCFLFGRLRFGDASNLAPFPSAMVYAGEDVRRFHAAFSDLGTISASSRLWRAWPKVERAPL